VTVVRALRSRGMVEEKGGWLSLTEAGRATLFVSFR
jgi:hypothetical protein